MAVRPAAPETLPAALAGHAQEIALDVCRLGRPHAPVATRLTLGGVAVSVVVMPAELAALDLPACGLDVVGVLASAHARLTVPDILADLEGRRLICGEASVKRAVAVLRDAGLVLGSRRQPRGYWLAARADLG